ncbi:MAG: ABC transporter ATP-binding protein [Candidatus Pacebacteria bacterium]|nr:ABC transporter ATP-binding protein [Candidatus Paceibacterota bacterium]
MPHSVEQKQKKATFSFRGIGSLFKNTHRIIALVWGEKKKLVISLAVLAIIEASIPFIVSGVRGELINELVRTAGQGIASDPLIWWLVAFVITLIIPALFSVLDMFSYQMFIYFIEEKFEMLIIAKKGEIDMAVQEDPQYNDLFNRVREDGVGRIQNFLVRQFTSIISIIGVIVASIIIVSFKWWLLLVIIIGTIPELITETKYGQYIWSIYESKSEIRRKYINIREHFNWLNQLTELKLFQNVANFTERIRVLFLEFQNEQRKNERNRLKARIGSSILSQAVIAVGGVWFVFEVVNGRMEIGTLVFALTSITQLRATLSEFFGTTAKQYQDNLFVSDVFKFLDIKQTLSRSHNPVVLDANSTPEIEFKKVSFAYPGTTRRVLKNISFTIPAGQKLAIVGVNGAGKTTLIKLLCRFYDPTEGVILVNGRDLKTIDIQSWYHMIGALFQDYARYHFEVKEAIAVGRLGLGTDIEKVKASAQAAEADVFIEEWEKKYHQQLGKIFSGGIEPSVGQWQKLALARTFYRDPRVMILDEPTSSIDAQAEAKIFEKLEQLPKDRTVLLISHRFSTVRRAHAIMVIKDGTMTEYGTHAQLLKKKGIYAQLFTLQAKGYK